MSTAAELKKNKTRDNNFELLRIVAMLMVVSIHYLARGGGLTQNTLFGLNCSFAWTLEAISMVSVNCYVLISSYFLVNAQFRLKRLLRLWLQILFYSIGIYLVLSGIGMEHFSIKHLLLACIPVLTDQYWFATAYIALYILSPFLNMFIRAISKKQMQILLAILFIMLSLWPTVLPFGVALDKNNGHTITHFMFLYFIGAYIRLYWNYELKKSYCISGYFLITALMIASKVIITLLGFHGFEYFLYECNSATVILASVMSFMLFKSISIKSIFLNKIIGPVAALTFGVYLIHDNILIRHTFYDKVLHANLFSNTPAFIPVTVASILGIFITCAVIDAVRKMAFTIIEGSRLSGIVKNYFSRQTAKFSGIIQEKAITSLNYISK
ncbi:MAG: acyltransferase [Ignavibacteria bacterium]|jgi:hypothetical protein|nr:acyltransferase [Ignavibacteria bacterium]MCU7505139.1 acyltransferase [Ignavibacteria bacterium]MCU7518009.1 acyltransferase [Ignavibacteria bacterium]